MARSKPKSRPKLRPRPEPQRESTGKGWTQNALATALISVLVSGAISVGVAVYQNNDSAKQARQARQIQEAGQLESAAGNLYQISTSVYNFQMQCARTGDTWQECANLAPRFKSYSAANTAFISEGSNVKDQQASTLATQMSTAASKMITTSASAAVAKTQWYTMLDDFVDLEGRCSQLIQAGQ